jgi:fluoride ion exporter CrcB/FEX
MSTLVITLGATMLAGGLGAVVRALVSERLPGSGITVVNLAGTLLLALVIVLEGRGSITASTAFVVGVGFSGSLTTFSGWIARIVAGLEHRPLPALGRELLAPLGAAVALTVLVFATLGG